MNRASEVGKRKSCLFVVLYKYRLSGRHLEETAAVSFSEATVTRWKSPAAVERRRNGCKKDRTLAVADHCLRPIFLRSSRLGHARNNGHRQY